MKKIPLKYLLLIVITLGILDMFNYPIFGYSINHLYIFAGLVIWNTFAKESVEKKRR